MEFNFSPFELLYYVNTLQQKHPDLGGSKEVYKWWNLHGRTNSSQPEKKSRSWQNPLPTGTDGKRSFCISVSFFLLLLLLLRKLVWSCQQGKATDYSLLNFRTVFVTQRPSTKKVSFAPDWSGIGLGRVFGQCLLNLYNLYSRIFPWRVRPSILHR